MIFRESFKVNSHACDYNRIATPSAIMTYLQECANLQLETYGPSDAEMRADGHCFVLSRFGMAVYSPIKAYEALTAETWAAEAKGFSFFRCHRILRGNDIICEATSVWALIGIDDRRPQRAESMVLRFESEPMSAFGLPARFRIDGAALSPVGQHTVGYRDTDLNMHMNNTVYADILCSHLDMRGRYVSRLALNYFHEAPLGTELTVYRQKETDDTYLFRTLRAGGETNVEASITLASI